MASTSNTPTANPVFPEMNLNNWQAIGECAETLVNTINWDSWGDLSPLRKGGNALSETTHLAQSGAYQYVAPEALCDLTKTLRALAPALENEALSSDGYFGKVVNSIADFLEDEAAFRFMEMEHEEEREENPIRLVFRESWTTSAGGWEESRELVGQSADGFHPGLEIAPAHQESHTSWGEAVSTQKEALQLAHEMFEQNRDDSDLAFDAHNLNAVSPTPSERAATPMATATATPTTSSPASVSPIVIFSPESILSEKPAWYERVGGVNQLPEADQAIAQKDFDAYIKPDPEARLGRYANVESYVAARQKMNGELRTAKHAINEYAAGKGTLGGTLSAIRNSDPEKLYFSVHSQLKSVGDKLGKESAAYIMLAKLDKPLREDMLIKQAKQLKPGAWQLASGFGSLSAKQLEQATAAWQAMKSRGGKGADQTLETFVNRSQAETKRRREMKPNEQTFEYKPLAVDHWMLANGGRKNLNDNQGKAALAAFQAARKNNPKLDLVADKSFDATFDKFIEERQAARANNDAIMAKVSHIFENPEAAKKTLQSIYGVEAGKQFFDSISNSAETGKVKTAKVLDTFQLTTEKVEGQVVYTAIPKPGKQQEMGRLIREGQPVAKEQVKEQAKEKEQQKEGAEPAPGARQKTQRRTRERAHSR